MAFKRLSGTDNFELSTQQPYPATPRDYARSISPASAYENPRSYDSSTAVLDHGSQPGLQDPISYIHDIPPATPHRGRPWRTGFWNRFPWLGFLALLGTVAFTFAAMTVLVVSNHKPIEDWGGPWTPNTYISISTAVANILLTYAFYQGTVISFWRTAGKGVSLLELHQTWHSGASLWGAMRGMVGWRGQLPSLACIFVLLSILRGPFLQRASSVKNVNVAVNGTLQFHAALSLPLGYAGTDSGRTVSPSYMNPNFTAIVQDYTKGNTVNAVHQGCGATSTCRTSIRGFGFGVQCTKSGIFYSVAPKVEANGSVSDLPTVEAFSTSVSSTSIDGFGPAKELDNLGNLPESTNGYNNTALQLNSTFIPEQTSTDNGTMTSHVCALRGGVVSYPIQINNNTVTLQDPSWKNDTFLEDRGLQPLPYSSFSNIAGFILAADYMYTSNSTYQFGGGVGYILNLQGPLANQYLRRPSAQDNFYDLSSVSWRDPMDDMINGMREIAFRSSLQVAADNLTFPESRQNVTFHGSKPETVYTSDTGWMVAGMVVSLVGVLFTIPLYRGFWEIGRPVSLSPLEIAKAFDAPLLTEVEGNMKIDEALKDGGQQFVKYGDTGVAASSRGLRKLRLANMNTARTPERGAWYV